VSSNVFIGPPSPNAAEGAAQNEVQVMFDASELGLEDEKKPLFVDDNMHSKLAKDIENTQEQKVKE